MAKYKDIASDIIKIITGIGFMKSKYLHIRQLAIQYNVNRVTIITKYLVSEAEGFIVC